MNGLTDWLRVKFYDKFILRGVTWSSCLDIVWYPNSLDEETTIKRLPDRPWNSRCKVQICTCKFVYCTWVCHKTMYKNRDRAQLSAKLGLNCAWIWSHFKVYYQTTKVYPGSYFFSHICRFLYSVYTKFVVTVHTRYDSLEECLL